VFRDVAYGAARGSLGGDLELAALEGAQAGDHLGELGLAIAVHAGDRRDLAREELQVDAAERRDAAIRASVCPPEPEDTRALAAPGDGRVRGADRPGPAGRSAAAHHELRELGRVGVARSDLGDDVAPA